MGSRRFGMLVAIGIGGCMGLLVSPTATIAQEPIASAGVVRMQYADAIEQGRRALRTLMEMSGVPGMSVAVGVHGNIVWSEGFGYADLEQRAPVTPLTRFRIASVSKVITAAAVARLHELGRLDLDAPVQRYVPAFPDKGHVLTTRQLTGQLGGIRHYDAKDFAEGRNIDFKHYSTTLDALAIFKDDPLIAAPGTRYNYSTFGYTLVGAGKTGTHMSAATGTASSWVASSIPTTPRTAAKRWRPWRPVWRPISSSSTSRPFVIAPRSATRTCHPRASSMSS